MVSFVLGILGLPMIRLGVILILVVLDLGEVIVVHDLPCLCVQ